MHCERDDYLSGLQLVKLALLGSSPVQIAAAGSAD